MAANCGGEGRVLWDVHLQALSTVRLATCGRTGVGGAGGGWVVVGGAVVILLLVVIALLGVVNIRELVFLRILRAEGWLITLTPCWTKARIYGMKLKFKI